MTLAILAGSALFALVMVWGIQVLWILGWFKGR